MPIQTQELPSSMTSPETGEVLTRGVRPFTVSYKGHSVTVDLPGYYPDGEGDGVHVGDDMAAADVGAPRAERARRWRPVTNDHQARAGETEIVAACGWRRVPGWAERFRQV